METKTQIALEALTGYNPSSEEKAVLSLVLRHFQSAQNQKNRAWHHLRDSNIEEFMQRSRDHYNGYVPQSNDIDDDWKSRAFKLKTRSKVIGVAASFLSSGLGIDIAAQDFEERLDRAMSQVIDDVFEWSLNREDFEVKLLRALLEMIITGTVHLQEEIVWREREIKEIEDIDFETGKIKTEKRLRTVFKGACSEVVPNEEMYPGDIWTHDIQEQPYLIRRKISTYEDSMELFSKYENWQYVQPSGAKFLNGSGAGVEQTEKEDAGDEDRNQVEIVYYWNKSEDLFAIVVNGVLLTDAEYPIPYPHKNYPFAKSVFEPFADSRFYWGDSLPNKNYDDQETVNELYRMFIDSTKLKNKPPLFTNNIEMAGTDLVVPGSVNAGDEGDVVRTIPELVQGVSQSEFNVFQMLEGQIDENSIDPLVAGQQASGDPTATEVRAVVGGAERVRAFNEQFIGDLLIQHAKLRIPNILWFMTHDDEYRRVVVSGVKTKKGKSGKRQITFADAADIPTPDLLLQAEQGLEAGMDGIDPQGPTDLIYVDKGCVNDYLFHVTLSATKRPTRSNASRVSRIYNKFRVYSGIELIDQMVNTRKLVEAFGDDPDEMLKAPQISMSPQQGPATLKTPPGNPQLDGAMANEDNLLPQV